MLGFLTIRTVKFSLAACTGLVAAEAASAQCPYSGKPSRQGPSQFTPLMPAPAPQTKAPPVWQDPDPAYFHVRYWHKPQGGEAAWCLLRNRAGEVVCFTNKSEAEATASQLQARGVKADVQQAYFHVHYWHSVNGQMEECLLRDPAGEVVCFPTQGKAATAARQLQEKYGYRTEVRPSEQGTYSH